jgi:hypothetical protein
MNLFYSRSLVIPLVAAVAVIGGAVASIACTDWDDLHSSFEVAVVALDGSIITVRVTGMTLVAAVKAEVAKQTGMGIASQILVAGDGELKDTDAMWECGIMRGKGGIADGFEEDAQQEESSEETFEGAAILQLLVKELPDMVPDIFDRDLAPPPIFRTRFGRQRRQWEIQADNDAGLEGNTHSLPVRSQKAGQEGIHEWQVLHAVTFYCVRLCN